MTSSQKLRQQLQLRVICEAPPPSLYEDALTEFGIQDKHGVVHAGQPEADGSVVFDITVDVPDTGAGSPRFRGPFFHGPVGSPFLYLSWRMTAEGSPWIRRMKVPLSGITTEQITAAYEDGLALVARVGGLVASTAKMQGYSWTVEKL
jgi:hypothetical protein